VLHKKIQKYSAGLITAKKNMQRSLKVLAQASACALRRITQIIKS